MAVDERRRHEMYLAFEQLVGGEVAATMMEHLPPVGWADVATKHDVEREVALSRSELQAGLAEVRSEMQTGFAEVRSEMQTGFADLRVEIARSSQRSLMWMAGVMVPGFVALFAAIVARS
jgi:hypothetical protein